MAIVLSDNIQVNAPKPADSRYLNILVPYASVSAATTAIVTGVRFTGLTVNIQGNEYWFKNGIGNSDLIQKSLGGTITGATNGLSTLGQKVKLGGALIGTGATNISLNSIGGNLIITGLTTSGASFGLSVVNFDSQTINPFVAIGQIGEFGYPEKHYINIDQGSVAMAQCRDNCCGCINLSPTSIGMTIQTLSGPLLASAIAINQETQFQSAQIRLYVTSGSSGCKAELCIGRGWMKICGANSTGFTGVEYDSDYSASFVNESLVTKRYVNSRISGSSNITNVCNVNTQYTATTTSSFIGVSGASCIYLMNNPSCGQRVSVADICGGALVNPITINGNSKRINDSSCCTSLINTNYGSITFIYNGYFWSAVAFTN